MMTILDKIVADKRKEVELLKKQRSIQELEQSPYFQRTCFSISTTLRDENSTGIIAEIKRKSPSRGDIHPKVDVAVVSSGYIEAGASAISILTDTPYFGGKNEDVSLARSLNQAPILRKEFIVDEYQIVEAKSIGADVILLIASVLSPAKIKTFAATAKSLGMETLMEVHDKEELARSLNEYLHLVGVNNRNLKDFSVDINTSFSLAPKIPDDFVKVAESGLSKPKEVLRLSQHGFQGFLMGQRFMETQVPAKACAEFVGELKVLQGSMLQN